MSPPPSIAQRLELARAAMNEMFDALQAELRAEGRQEGQRTKRRPIAVRPPDVQPTDMDRATARRLLRLRDR